MNWGELNCQIQIHASNPSIHLGIYQVVKWYKSSGHTIKPVESVWNSTTIPVVKTGRVTTYSQPNWIAHKHVYIKVFFSLAQPNYLKFEYTREDLPVT